MYEKHDLARVAQTGLVLAVGITIGIALTLAMRSLSDGGTDGWLVAQELKLRAQSAQGSDTFTIATGPVDGAVDGVFCLDHRTGDLTGFVMHPRIGKFATAFKTNITKDLPPGEGKMPHYVMTIGRARLGPLANMTPGNCLIYVADVNTGAVAAYAFPWNISGKPKGESSLATFAFENLDIAQSRDVKLPE